MNYVQVVSVAILAACALAQSSWAVVPVRISQEPATGELVGPFEVAHDGSVLYQFGSDSDDTKGVWRATLANQPQLVSGSLSLTRNVRPAFSRFALSPDGQFVHLNVAFEGSPSDIEHELFRAPVGGGVPTAVQQDPTAPSSRPLQFYEAWGFTPDGSELMYLADHEQHGVFDLYAQSTSGGPARRITPARSPGTSLETPQFVRLTPNGQRLIYVAGFLGASYKELYSVPLAGGAAVQLNAGLPNVHYLANQAYDSSGQGIVFGSDGGLFRADLATGAQTLLSPPFQVNSYTVSQDGSMVGYRYGADLFGVPSMGGTSVQFTTDGAGTPFYTELFYTSDNSRFIYEDIGGTAKRLLSIPAVGGSATNLASSLPPGTAFQSVTLSTPNGEDRILYQTYPQIGFNGPKEIFSVRPDGTGRTRLNMPFDPLSSLETDSFFLTPDKQFLIFGVATTFNFREHAWYVTPTEGGPIVRLTPELPDYATIEEFKPSPDGEFFYYTADDRTNGFTELYRVGMPVARVLAGSEKSGTVNGGDAAVGGVSFEFDAVQTAGVFVGETSLVELSALAGFDPGLLSPAEMMAKAHVFDLSFTGAFSGLIDLSLQFADPTAPSALNAPKLFRQLAGGQWIAVSGLQQPTPGAIGVSMSSLGRFAVVQTAAVPEPHGAMLMVLAAVTYVGCRRRRKFDALLCG
jgi:hypothetical protein